VTRAIEPISPPQRRALEHLAKIVAPGTYLAGGVAVALRLLHRTSRDLDLFKPDGDLLRRDVTLPSLSILVVERSEGSLHLEVDSVPTSVLRYAYPHLEPPEDIRDVPVPVASLADLGCMKLSAIGGRGARRDFWDFHAIMSASGRALPWWLDLFEKKFAGVDVGHVVRALVYFDDAEAEPPLPGLDPPRWAGLRADLEAAVRAL
jgi:hypothetical protein